MKKNKELIVMLTAFVVGQLFQMMFIAVAIRLYVAYPVRWCISAGFITSLLVGTTMFVTVLVTSASGEHTAEEPKKTDRATPYIPDEDKKIKALFLNKRPTLDTDPEDIDEVDENQRKEG